MSEETKYNYDDVLGQFAALSLENKAKFLLKATFETAFSAFEELSNLMGDTYDTVTKERMEDFAEKMQDVAEKMKDKAEEVPEKVREKAEEISDDVKETMSNETATDEVADDKDSDDEPKEAPRRRSKK